MSAMKGHEDGSGQKPPPPIVNAIPDDGYSLRRGLMRLPICIAVNQTGEYHSYKDIRGYVTPTPLGVAVFSGRCAHCFLHCLSCPDQNLNALPNLHQHVTVVL